MLNKLLLTLLLTTSLGLAGCATPGGPNEEAGMVIGGILGGVLGSHVGKGHGRTAAIIIGSVIGANIGGNVGRSMDDSDRLKAAHAFENVRTGVRSSWRNPDTGNYYEVTPTKTYSSSAGPCREYVLDATIGGKPQKVYGTACRQPDGSWKTRD